MIGPPAITAAIAEMGSVIGLANPNLGQELVRPLLESGEILWLSREVVRPFYRQQSLAAQGWVREAFGDDFDYAVHASEAAVSMALVSGVADRVAATLRAVQAPGCARGAGRLLRLWARRGRRSGYRLGRRRQRLAAWPGMPALIRDGSRLARSGSEPMLGSVATFFLSKT